MAKLFVKIAQNNKHSGLAFKKTVRAQENN